MNFDFSFKKHTLIITTIIIITTTIIATTTIVATITTNTIIFLA